MPTRADEVGSTGAAVGAEPAEDLVVAQGFPPAGGRSAVRTALRVRAAGRPVDVLHCGGAAGAGTDEGARALAGHLVRREARVPLAAGRAEAAGAAAPHWGAVRDVVEEGVQVALGWDRARTYRRVLSSAEPAARLLAARVVLQRPELRWTAPAPAPEAEGGTGRAAVGDDALADLLLGAVASRGLAPPASREVDALAGAVTLALAAELLVGSERHLERLVAGLDPAVADDVRARAVVAAGPLPPPDLYEVAATAASSVELPADRHHLVAFGPLDGPGPRSSLLAAVAALPPEVRARVALHVWTEDAGGLWRAARDRGVAQSLVAHRPVPYLDSLALMRRAELLVVPDVPVPGAVPHELPERWADVRGSGVPVWTLPVPGSPLSLQEADRTTPAGHVSAAVQVLGEAAAGRFARRGGA